MNLITTQRPNNEQVAGREAINKGLPWIVPESLTALEPLLWTGMRIFEWGSGGSTLYWLKHDAYVTTLERKSRWYFWTRNKAQDLAGKLDIVLIPMNGKADDDYANAIKGFDDGTFDLVFVDGEAPQRNQALHAAAPKIKSDGILLLDNSNWYDTKWLHDEWTETRWQTIEYPWLGKSMVWATSIIRRK
jgi:predicted O-methyltransferase YrrM